MRALMEGIDSVEDAAEKAWPRVADEYKAIWDGPASWLLRSPSPRSSSERSADPYGVARKVGEVSSV